MLFTSLQYIAFFTILFIVYYNIPLKRQYICLLVASLFFYMSAGIQYAVFLIGTAIITYFGAILIGNRRIRLNEAKKSVSAEEAKEYAKRTQSYNKCIVASVVILLIGTLIYIKYLNFIFSVFAQIGSIFSFAFSPVNFSLIYPIGFSFYVFQSLGYVIDVYRGMHTAEKNFLKHLLFVSFFPQILQGPIGHYGELMPQLIAEHKFDRFSASNGIKRILWGFFKKLVVVENIALITSPVLSGANDSSGIIIVGALIGYAFQLYADFSGYMDIAVGCSEMLGIKIKENFNTPYFSKSIAEFWRRWHIHFRPVSIRR